jgi:malate dehydrogenase (decarboxylating)
LCFNDDIQGTAATILAGLKGAMKVSGKIGAELCNQRFVVCGAGSAGSGAIMTVYNTLIEKYGMDPKDAAKCFYVLDKDGLITKARKNIKELS